VKSEGVATRLRVPYVILEFMFHHLMVSSIIADDKTM